MKTPQFQLKKKPTRWFRRTILVLALIVNSFANAQENPSQKQEKGSLFENYYNNTIFKIKNEKGISFPEHIFEDEFCFSDGKCAAELHFNNTIEKFNIQFYKVEDYIFVCAFPKK